MRATFITSIIIFTIGTCMGQKIVAPSIGEWSLQPDTLPSVYNYNSIAVFLVNGTKLKDLFTGENLEKSQRKKIKLKKADYPKYIYLYLEIENPYLKGDTLKFPLYMIDALDESSIAYSEQYQGKILDQLSDDVLLKKEIIASAKLKTIKGNKTAEFVNEAYSISNDLLSTAASLSQGPLGTAQIINAVNKGGQYFKRIAASKEVTNDFPIPITKNETSNLTYVLKSASVHQIKWDVEGVDPDPWSKISGTPTKDNLIKLLGNNSPYIVVVRYKSKYVLPPDKNKIEISQDYVNKRSLNISKLGGQEYDVEDNFLSVLKNVISLKKDFDVYTWNKENGRIDEDAVDRIIKSYFTISQLTIAEKKKNDLDPKRKNYWDLNYREPYQFLNNFVDDFFKSNIEDVKIFVDALVEVADRKDLQLLEKEKLYGYIKNIDYYRDFTERLNNNNQSTSGITLSKLYELSNEKLKELENQLIKKLFVLDPHLTIEQKKEFLTQLINDFSHCEDCKKKASEAITAFENSDLESKKSELIRLKEKYPKYINFFEKVTTIVSDSLKKKYPNGEFDCIDEMQKVRYHDLERIRQTLNTKAKEFILISQLDINSITNVEIPKILSNYNLILQEFKNGYLALIDYNLIIKIDNPDNLLD